MGNVQEFRKMMELVASRKIKTVIESEYPAKDIGLAFERMEKGKQFGKIVINLKQF